jgi:glycosyltransferase involved in cell wall biosynthesis
MRRATPPAAVSVCVSAFVRDELVEAGLVTRERSLVAYPLLGSATAPEPPAPRRGHRDGGLVLGYLGRVDPVKGVEAAIRTAAAYRRQTGDDVTLLIAGAGRPDYLRRLSALAAAEHVPVHLAGVLDVETFCARVDVVLIPSLWMEPFGRVAVEVGSRGLPMLVSPLGGLPEAAAVSGGRFGFADFDKPDAAGRALAELLAGDPHRQSARPEEGSPAVATVGGVPPAITVADGVSEAVARVLAERRDGRREQST